MHAIQLQVYATIHSAKHIFIRAKWKPLGIYLSKLKDVVQVKLVYSLYMYVRVGVCHFGVWIVLILYYDIVDGSSNDIKFVVSNKKTYGMK